MSNFFSGVFSMLFSSKTQSNPPPDNPPLVDRDLLNADQDRDAVAQRLCHVKTQNTLLSNPDFPHDESELERIQQPAEPVPAPSMPEELQKALRGDGTQQ
jgi:hypothetical protein